MTEDVKTLTPEQTVGDVSNLLAEYAIQHVPVANGGQLKGMVSSTDVLEFTNAVFSGKSNDATPQDYLRCPIAKIMQSDVVTVQPDDRVRDVAELLAKDDFHSVPVVNEDNEIVGIVTDTDLIAVLLEELADW